MNVCVFKNVSLSSCQDCGCWPRSKGAAENRHAGLQAACHCDVAPCMCAVFTRRLACVYRACLSVRGQCAREIQLLFETPYSKREQSSPCQNGRGPACALCHWVLMSQSSGGDCLRDELKAAASARAVHLHWYLHSLPKWHHYHLLSTCTTGMRFT